MSEERGGNKKVILAKVVKWFQESKDSFKKMEKLIRVLEALLGLSIRVLET